MRESSQYETYEVADFLLDDCFVEWVQTDCKSDFWKTFLIRHPNKALVIDQAKAIILAGEMVPVYFPTEGQVTMIWEGIKDAINHGGYPFFIALKNRRLWPYFAAASIAIFLGTWLWFKEVSSNRIITYENLLSHVREPLLEVINPNIIPIKVKLPDGSSVKLSKGGRISYPKTFSKSQRDVYLSGEGFFEVVKNPKRPFFVHANELVTKVLGTSFTIRTYENEKSATVTVHTGKVFVFAQNEIKPQKNFSYRELEGIVLTPNQLLTFERNQVRMVKSLVAEPVMLTNDLKTGAFSFANVPISNVFNTIEKAYGVDIIYDEELLKNCRLSASMSNEPLFEKLRMICKTLGGSYSVIDAQIIIQSSGCDH